MLPSCAVSTRATIFSQYTVLGCSRNEWPRPSSALYWYSVSVPPAPGTGFSVKVPERGASGPLVTIWLESGAPGWLNPPPAPPAGTSLSNEIRKRFTPPLGPVSFPAYEPHQATCRTGEEDVSAKSSAMNVPCQPVG